MSSPGLRAYGLGFFFQAHLGGPFPVLGAPNCGHRPTRYVSCPRFVYTGIMENKMETTIV